jgi:dihydroxyacetone kinase-like protein
MINGMGGTPISELYLLYAHGPRTGRESRNEGQTQLCCEYCTRWSWAGFSLTLVKLDPELEDSCLAAPAEIAVRIF